MIILQAAIGALIMFSFVCVGLLFIGFPVAHSSDG